METVTIAQGWAWLLAAASAFILICNAVEKIFVAVKAAKAPERAQSEEIKKIKADVDEIKSKLAQDKLRLDDSQAANRITQEALLALLEHGLNGNNVDQMNNAKTKLHNYLINH